MNPGRHVDVDAAGRASRPTRTCIRWPGRNAARDLLTTRDQLRPPLHQLPVPEIGNTGRERRGGRRRVLDAPVAVLEIVEPAEADDLGVVEESGKEAGDPHGA